MLQRITALLSSKKLSLFLFFALAIFLIPGTLQPSNTPLYNYLRFTLLAIFLVNLSVCSATRFRSLHNHTLIIHLGCLLTILGSMAGNFGYIATTNLYVGESASTAYRWDMKSDAPLGFELNIKRINKEYYPVLIKIGVKDNGREAALFQLKTGESFTYQGYRIQTKTLDIEENTIKLSIYKDDKFISHYQTTRNDEDEPVMNDIPLAFKLVAFKNPTVKKLWLNLEVTQDGETTKAISGVNQPFTWNGLKFFHTETGHDPFGTPYAGVQIVRDPGIPLVYFGFITIMLGCFLLLWNQYKTSTI